MNYADFKRSLSEKVPPAELSLPLDALWHAAKGDWEAAHERAQRQHDAAGAWVHAHLHRQEGDLDNARYWYSRAGRPSVTGSLDEERDAIVRALCDPAATAP
jgi:hypothetical protein